MPAPSTPLTVYTTVELATSYPDHEHYIHTNPECIVIHNGRSINKLFVRIGLSDNRAVYKETTNYITIKKEGN